jgi:hypothetical protein
MMLEGLVDLHVHTEPDVRLRSCNDLQLAREAKRIGARAVVIKSHHFVTADRAAIARAAVAGVSVYGGVTLNPSVGGLNPAAVEAAIKVGAKLVWLPTLFASNHRQKEGKGGGISVVVDGRACCRSWRRLFVRWRRQISRSQRVICRRPKCGWR